MTQRILLFFLLAIGYQTLMAQDPAGCNYLLEDAKEAYTAGMVELIPALLLPCLEADGLTGSSKREAYKLVINAYLFDDLPQQAEDLMNRFVEEYPNYRAGSADPAEFELLLNNILISKGIDPDDLDEYVAEGDTASTRSRKPRREKVLGVTGHSLGFQAGINGSFPQVMERYSLGDPGEDQGHFGIQPGFQVGANINYVLNDHFEISADLIFNLVRFSYAATPLTDISYKYIENGNHFQLPVSLIYLLNPESEALTYYARAGVVADYLLSAHGSGTRTSDATGNEVSVGKTELTGSRNQINLLWMAGMGIRYPLNRSFFYAEARFSLGILQSNRAENRYMNNDLNWMLYHVDSDFRTHQISICAGICWDITKEEDL
jgi:hypothetical protein